MELGYENLVVYRLFIGHLAWVYTAKRHKFSF